MNRIAQFFSRHREYDDLSEEIRSHLLEKIDELQQDGMSRRDAEQAARRAFGNVRAIEEQAREAWGWRRLEDLAADVRYGARNLVRHPGYSLTTILTLTIAMGLNVSLFTVFNAVFIQPWPVRHPGSVFVATTTLVRRSDGVEVPGAGFNLEEFAQLREQAQRSRLVAYDEIDLRGTSTTAEVVSPDFFEVLGVPLQAGSGLSGTSDATVVISDGFWRRIFGADPSVLGRIIDLDVPRRVVGIVGPAFSGIPPKTIDVYVPLPSSSDWVSTWQRWWGTQFDARPAQITVDVAGRLDDGRTRGQAQVELSALYQRIHQHDSTVASTGQVTLSGTARGQRPGGVRNGVPLIFALLFGATLLVLILGCANVGNLQLARSLARRAEIATRLALGASRRRIVSQFVIEGALLAAVAAVGAAALAEVLPAWILSFDPIEARFPPRPDSGVFALAMLLAGVTTIAFSLLPALRITRGLSLPMDRLKGRAGTAFAGRTRGVLLGVQVAISTMLLVVATLLSRGLIRVVTTDLGFEYDSVIHGALEIPNVVNDRPHALALRASLDAVATERNLDLAYAAAPPLSSIARADLRVAGSSRALGRVPVVQASENYFSVLGIPVLAGRTFSEDPARLEVVVNRQFVRQLFPDGSPLGAQLLLSGRTWTIVGVVRDAHLHSLDTIYPTVFVSLDWAKSPWAVLVRNAQPTDRPLLSAAVTNVDPRMAMQVFPLSGQVLTAARNSIAAASVVSGIGLLALALAIVGVFGTFGFVVEERRREIGIRLALGARNQQIVGALLSMSRLPLVGGLAAGVVAALVTAQTIQHFLYELSPVDLPTYLVVLLILASAGVIAIYAPARRAIRVDPAVTLRCD